MSNVPFPGFEEDEPKPAQPATPAPTRSAPPAAVQYELDMGSEDEAPKPKKAYVPPPVETAPAPTAPAPAPAAPKAKAPAPAPAPDAVPDADLKPGSRKDLWACPHCGTKNQPQRTSCRSCGKSPSEAVVVPLFKRPLVLAGLGVAALGLIALVVMASQPDLTLREPVAEQADKALRQGKAHGPAREIDGRQFTPRGTVAVCGRVAATSRGGSVTSVALVLGKGASDDAIATGTTAISDGRVVDAPEGCELLHLIFEQTPPSLTKGAWLSLVGERGELADATGLDGGTTILVLQHRL